MRALWALDSCSSTPIAILDKDGNNALSIEDAPDRAERLLGRHLPDNAIAQQIENLSMPRPTPTPTTCCGT